MFFESVLKIFFQVLAVSWWVLVPLGLFFVFWEQWIYYIRRRFIFITTKWALLEIKIPGGVEKTPKAMEQVFGAMRAGYSYGFNFKQKYWQGQAELPFSLEMIGHAGGVNFYIRTPEQHRNLVESAIYSQYPEAEIHPAEDYIGLFGTTLPNKAYNLWGADLILGREDGYPLRTYPSFEEKIDEARLDPIAAIAEAMSRLKSDETILIQFLIRPTGDEWVKKAEALRDKLIDRQKAKKKTFADTGAEFARNLVWSPIEHPKWEGKKEDKKETKLLVLTPGEREILESIEKKMAKLAYDGVIRFLYVDSKDSFTGAHISAVMGSFHQFNTHNLNFLRPDKSTFTVVSTGLFKKKRAYLRKRRLFDNYRYRRMPRKSSVFNVEEIATIFHIPSIAVEAPMLRHLPVKKGEPPAGLPVE